MPLLADSSEADLLNATVPVERPLDIPVAYLGEMLWKAKSASASQAVLERLLQKHEPKIMPMTRVLRDGIAIIEASSGQISVQDIAHALEPRNDIFFRPWACHPNNLPELCVLTRP